MGFRCNVVTKYDVKYGRADFNGLRPLVDAMLTDNGISILTFEDDLEPINANYWMIEDKEALEAYIEKLEQEPERAWHDYFKDVDKFSRMRNSEVLAILKDWIKHFDKQGKLRLAWF